MITCANCHTPNEPDAQYCDDCGAAIAKVGEAAPPQHTGATQANRISLKDESRDAHTGGRTMPFVLVSSSPSSGSMPSNNASLATAMAPQTEMVSPADDNGTMAGNASNSSAGANLEPATMNNANANNANVERHPAASNAPHAKLVIERGRSAGKGFLINEPEAHIGRWDADGGIFPDVDLDSDDPEAKVSRRHARIILRADGYYIEDLGSTNGTFVNRGRRLLPGALQPLRDGDEIIVGKTFLRLQIIK